MGCGVGLAEDFEGVEDGLVDGAVDGENVGDEDGTVVGDELGDVEAALPLDEASLDPDDPLDPALLIMSSCN